jgi:hypothetical protein
MPGIHLSTSARTSTVASSEVRTPRRPKAAGNTFRAAAAEALDALG